MLQSLRILYQAPYNKLHKISALYRFFYWKIIRVLKLKNVAYNIWDDRKFYLSYDSFHSMWVMYNCVVDWEEFNLIRDYLQPNDTTADIGANIGYYSVWMSK